MIFVEEKEEGEGFMNRFANAHLSFLKMRLGLEKKKNFLFFEIGLNNDDDSNN